MRVPMSERKKLTDILHGSQRDRIARLWETTKPAVELKPIPSGEYRCRIVDGNLFNAKSGTPGYKLTLEVIEGEFVGRRLWWDCWLTEDAMPGTLRDLAKLGVTDLAQLERPLPEGIIVAARVSLRRNDDGSEYNRVSRFDVVAIEPAEPNPFAPGAEPIDGSTRDVDGFDWASGQQEGGAES
jgi:hypothetical protein